ncbi:class I SAM-dependent methyltransferase [Candidatus Parcubacteria bacterium]|nr:class I SAM-dependent methyltransferase [Candidatus Parcubacteria bacterium]
MNWRQLPIDQKNLEKSYTEKYGLGSKYQTEQERVYLSPEIYPDLKTAISWLTLTQGDTVLDIGVNNGYELELFQNISEQKWLDSISVIGFDIIEEVLQKAWSRFENKSNYMFVKGNILDFKGKDISNDTEFKILDNSIDIIIALTSLQSTSIIENFEIFIENLMIKLKDSAQILVGTPNFHLDANNNIGGGLFDANEQKVDVKAARNFSDKLTAILISKGFQHKQFGETIIFDYFRREN